MKVCLLYEDRERGAEKTYYDTESIIQDLGLKALFMAASKEVIYENGEVKKLDAQDLYVADAVRKVMMEPLTTKEQIEFRQAIIKDSLQAKGLIPNLYDISSRVMQNGDEQNGGQRAQQKGSPVANLLSDLRRVQRLTEALAQIRDMMQAQEGLASQGLCAFRDELAKVFSPEREANIRKFLQDVSFYTDRVEVKDEDREMLLRPKIVFHCTLEDGLKLGPMKVEAIETQSSKFYPRGSKREKLQRFMESRMPDSFGTLEDVKIREQASTMEFEVVSYLSKKLKNFKDEFRTFFDQLKFQSAFYLGVLRLTKHIGRFRMEYCFPEVCDRRDLSFTDLKEFVMAIEQRVYVIGNTCDFPKKDLLIVTGANQGGKSTFLRSLGIAQVMMQCGMPVTAQSYKSGIFPRIFVHFTRREDSEMNSGRLDEELKRMSGIIDNIGDGSLILLNESFATTTEKEGAVIAYDIIRALKEAGVRILTVTHLHSFAKRVYDETLDDPDAGVEFLCAERREDGTRTFHMVQGAPDFTSFGLDLYEKIVGNIGEES